MIKVQLSNLFFNHYKIPLEILPSRYSLAFELLSQSWDSPIEFQFYQLKIQEHYKSNMPPQAIFELDHLYKLYDLQKNKKKRASDETLAKVSSHLVPEILAAEAEISPAIVSHFKTFSGYLQAQSFDESIQYLERNNISLNQHDLDGNTPLIHAVNRGAESFCLNLLRKGANPHISDSLGNTPLHWAVLQNQLRIADMLLYFGANPNTMNHNKVSSTSLSIVKSSDSFFQRFFNYGCNLFIIDSSGNTLLHKAITSRSIKNIRLLLLLNQPLHQRNSKGVTPYNLIQDDPAILKLFEYVTLEQSNPFNIK